LKENFDEKSKIFKLVLDLAGKIFWM